MSESADVEDNGFLVVGEVVAMPEKYILLEDTVARRHVKGWNPISKTFADDHILKGSLLLALNDGEARDSHQYFSPPLNYKKYSDDSVKLYCKPEHVHQLSEKHFQLLLAVKLPFDRYKALNILNLVEKLVVGHGVNVVVPPIPHPVKGILRYIGPLPGEEGTQFGVELMERRGEGASDGTFKHMDFFKCDRDCAMFVAMDKLSDLVDSKANNTAIDSQRHPPLTQDTPLKRGDGVTFWDEKDKASSGVVRWIGRNERVLPNKSLIVGIEIKHRIQPALIPDSLIGMNHYFDLRNPNGTKLFLPITVVMKTEIDHPYNTRSKDQQISSADPESTVHILQHYSDKEGQSAEHFKSSQQRELHQNWEAKKRHEEVVRAEQNKPPDTDVDLHEINIEEQRRIYEEARHASKQGGGGQRHDPKQQPGVCGGIHNSQQHGNRPPEYHRGSSVDPSNAYSHVNNGQQKSHGSPTQRLRQPQDRQHQGVYAHGQPGNQQHDPAAQMAHIRRGGVDNNPPAYNPATGMPYGDHTGGRGQPSQRAQHTYEPMPGPPPDQHDPSAQQYQHAGQGNPNSYKLDVGSLVMFGNPPSCGTIKRIGYRQDTLSAEVEVLEDNSGGGQYSESQVGKTVFLPVAHLAPDPRFGGVPTTGAPKIPNPLENYRYIHKSKGAEAVQCDTVLVNGNHLGREKGVQGHQNSCYLDATVYGMFAFTDVFDKLFLKSSAKGEHDDRVRHILLEEIVNPLRIKHVVVFDAVMNLRKALDELINNVKGLTSDEKDPEEFLNLLFKHVLFVKPFLQIRRPSGTDKEFFVQLFIEADKSATVPNIDVLLMKMFKGQNITFDSIPTRLLLQVPRYGKQFKIFDGIVPNLELDISELCDECESGLCYVCGEKAFLFCGDCKSYFCKECTGKWHGHPERATTHHSLHDNSIKLKLLSVICIQTSHYVCFSRITGSGTDEWVFFDSMAERQDDLYNIPEVRLCTKELARDVYQNPNIAHTPLNQLTSEMSRRFVRDAYLCIYADPQQVMYDDDDDGLAP